MSDWESRLQEQPTPMNLDDYLLSHLAQECAEVIVPLHQGSALWT